MPSFASLPLAQLEQTELGGIAGFAVDLIRALGGLGAGLAIALENLFPPLPSEVVLPLTGFAAARGVISLPSALAWTTLGSVVGAVAIYGLGAWLGRERFVALWTRLPLIEEEDLAAPTTGLRATDAPRCSSGGWCPVRAA